MDTAEENKPVIACTLTPAELKQRKLSGLAALKEKALEIKELPNGFASKFEYSNDMMQMLEEFVRTEKECCGFFEFTVQTDEDKRFVWLEVKGPQGVKEFIKAELEM